MTIKISQLAVDKWQLFRDLRLEALQEDPLAFASSFEEEKNYSQEIWQYRMANMWFALVDNTIAGMIGLIRSENKASLHCGYIVSLWIKPEFQGQGIATSMLRSVQSMAISLGIKKISLEVTTSQVAAVGLYEKLGFKKIALLEENLYKSGRFLDEYLMEWHSRDF
jgi:ribosomal protein S18 acetylase RimI-like enzyme